MTDARPGSKVTFTAAATGDPAPTVQWQRFVDGGWQDIARATSTTLRVTANRGVVGQQYRAVFTNALGSVTSDVATLTADRTRLTLVYLYQKVDPTKKASWANSGPQTLIGVRQGNQWVSRLSMADLPAGTCGTGWAVQTDLTEGLDQVPTRIDRATNTNVLGWQVVNRVGHQDLERLLGGPLPACTAPPAR